MSGQGIPGIGLNTNFCELTDNLQNMVDCCKANRKWELDRKACIVRWIEGDGYVSPVSDYEGDECEVEFNDEITCKKIFSKYTEDMVYDIGFIDIVDVDKNVEMDLTQGGGGRRRNLQMRYANINNGARDEVILSDLDKAADKFCSKQVHKDKLISCCQNNSLFTETDARLDCMKEYVKEHPSYAFMMKAISSLLALLFLSY